MGPGRTGTQAHILPAVSDQLRLGRVATWDRVLVELQGQAHAVADLEWVVSVDSTVARAHQHAAGAPKGHTGARSNHTIRRPEPTDHALGRSRGGWSTKTRLSVHQTGL